MIVSDRPLGLNLEHLRPLHDRLVLERVELPMDGLVVIPDVAQKPMHRGRVIAVGPGKRDEDGYLFPLDVRVGNIVQYQSADVDTGTHILIQEADILFIEGEQNG